MATRSSAEQRLERGFIRHAAMVARFEIDASRLAETRAQSGAVRGFASELLAQQGAAFADLQRLLHARGMAPPMLENAQRKALNRLGRMTGSRFDREYIAAVVQYQQSDKVLPYERVQGSLSDAALIAWVDRQLPLVRSQMAAAERLAPPVAGVPQRVPTRSVAPASHSR